MLDEIAQGKSNAAVAAALFLTERAVEKHINSLFAKLGLAEDPGRQPPGHGRAAATCPNADGTRVASTLVRRGSTHRLDVVSAPSDARAERR